MNDWPAATVGGESDDVNVTVVSAVYPVTLALPPMKFHEPLTNHKFAESPTSSKTIVVPLERFVGVSVATPASVFITMSLCWFSTPFARVMADAVVVTRNVVDCVRETAPASVKVCAVLP